jgi:hypothetical protein
MQTSNSLLSSIIFLGIAEEVAGNSRRFPIDSVNIIQLSQFKTHILYPSISGYTWVFLVRHGFIKEIYNENIKINIYEPDGETFETLDMIFGSPVEEENVQQKNDDKIIISHISDNAWKLIHSHIYEVITKPGTYTIKILYRNNEVYLGEVHFFYKKVPNYTSEQVRAIESDPYSSKAARVEWQCKYCPSTLTTYCALERIIAYEDKGYIWYKELPDEFICDCNKTSFKLHYFKESFHGLLGIDIVMAEGSYERRYSHAKINEIVQKFNEILRKNKDELPIQKFIEENTVILAKFSAKKIFFKPTVNGKFFADFAILNASNELLFIEIERPSLKLFKEKDGHPTAGLMHAYGQIGDWQEEYRKFPHSFLDKLSLKIEDVLAARWILVAGRKEREKSKNLQRHISKPFYDTEFLTYDDLASSLRQISRGLP